MRDTECIAFLQWALPRLELRWRGFKGLRRQVCRRLGRRCAELQLAGLGAYRRHLEATPAEWEHLAQLCRVTITRFGRDRAVWRRLVEAELPRLSALALAQGRARLDAWSAGCAGGEEPYTLAIAWQLEVAPRFPGLALSVLGTDIDEVELTRARAARYPAGVLRELPAAWRREALEEVSGAWLVRDAFRAPVRFERHDVRDAAPRGPFDAVLCRNLAFTYFEEPLQRAVATRLRAALRPEGIVVVGAHERVPGGVAGLERTAPCLYRATPVGLPAAPAP